MRQNSYISLMEATFKIADFGMCCISRTVLRELDFDFSDSINFETLTFMSLTPGLKSRKWMVTRPFSLASWIFILVSFIVLVIVIYCILAVKSSISANSLRLVVTNLYCIILNQHTLIIHNNLFSVRLIFSFWMLVCIVLSFGFTGRFYSILAWSEFDPPIDSIEQLEYIAKHDTGRIATFEDSIWLSELQGTSKQADPLYYHIAQHVKRNKPTMFDPSHKYIQQIENRPLYTIMVGNRMNFYFNRRIFATKPIHVSSANLRCAALAHAYLKKSSLYKPFNFVIKKIHEYGLYDKWLSNSYYRIASSKNHKLAVSMYGNLTPETQIDSLSLDELRSVFIVLHIGNSVSFVVFIVEIVAFKFKILIDKKLLKGINYFST